MTTNSSDKTATVNADDPFPQLKLRESDAGFTVMRQRWQGLLFLHWRVEAAEIAASLPRGLQVETFDGAAWVGIVPFQMRGVRPVGCPAIPGVSNFLELNLRTYVRGPDGRPGVWFYSLDCNQPLAVEVARAAFHLNYVHAKMHCECALNGRTRYRSQRRDGSAAVHYDWRTHGKATPAVPGSLEFFLVERYLLYAASAKGELFAGRVTHQPYCLRNAELRTWDSTLFSAEGLSRPSRPPDHITASDGVDVWIHPLSRVEKAQTS